MNRFIKEVVFPSGPSCKCALAPILFVLRLIVGGLMLIHGIQKLDAYEALATTFPDPIGLGSTLSLQLAIFAELVCSLAVIAGFMFRLALIPIIFTMCVATFVVLGGAGWNAQELAVIYLLLALLLIVTGPGRWSLDALIGNRQSR